MNVLVKQMPSEEKSRVAAVLAIGNFEGHRSDYMEALSALLPNSVRAPVPPAFGALSWTRAPLLFATLEDHGAAFFAIAALRSVRGRRTVAIFLRPGECFRPGRFKYVAKRWLFRLVSALPRTTILTILPFSLEPRFASVANGWIDDPRMWDLIDTEIGGSAASEAMRGELSAAAAGRRVLLALGGQNRIKGFEYFAKLWCSSAKLREKYLFCAAGLVNPECHDAKRRLREAGAVVFDKVLTNSELLGLYRSATAVWACYAPDYNQASGIFGRALQFGVPAVVRSGSFIEKLAAELEYCHVALRYDESTEAESRLLGWSPTMADGRRTRARVEAQRARSERILDEALFPSIRDAIRLRLG